MNIIDRLWNKGMIARKKVAVGKNTRINGRIYIHGHKGKVRIGKNSTINSDAVFNPTSGFSHTYLAVGDNGYINIGNNVGMSSVNITSYSGVEIEDDVLLGSGVKIWDLDFHEIGYEERMKKPESKGKTIPIKICEGAFVGACTIVLKGVTIGKYSVIGAGSIITKNIPEGEIWAGNPAKYIKKVNKVDR